MNPTDAAFCDACAARFPKPEVAQPSNRIRTVVSYAVVVTIAIALAVYLRYC
jgi:hypothetical protein